MYLLDGTPLAPPQPPSFSYVTVHSVIVEWEAPVTMAHAPILNYVIHYWTLAQSPDDAVSVETSSDATTFRLMLTPGYSYHVAVSGRNSVGLGAMSALGKVLIPLGVVTPAPQGIVADVVQLVDLGVALLTITWQVRARLHQGDG